jgi:3-phosphoshikimate 1-carboxyvinyltransferase
MYRILSEKIKEKEVELPSSKSISHRIAILAALNLGETSIQNMLDANDTRITIEALTNMGAKFRNNVEEWICNVPIGTVSREEIFLGNSGSSARFLIPLATFLDKPVYFYGDPRLHERPFRELFSTLNQLGVKLEANQKSLPVTIFPGELSGGTVRLEKLPSSQIITALMLAGLWMKNDLEIILPEKTPSLPYIKMTYKLMHKLNLNVEQQKNSITVEAKIPDYDWNFTVEKDLSAASYWVILALISGGKISLMNVTLPSLQGDEKIFQIAEEAGATVMCYSGRVEIEGIIKKGLTIDCNDIPDLVPSLSIMALFANEPVKLMNVEHLQYKESNRIEALQVNIASIGGKSEFEKGHFTIYPQQNYKGGQINTFNDHRIAMSFAVAGTKIPGIIIDNPECVNKSYPNFWKDFSYWQN